MYLKDELILNINKTKSYINNFFKKGILYLGYYFRYLTNNMMVSKFKLFLRQVVGIKDQLKARAIEHLQLRIPFIIILRRGIDCGYVKIQTNTKLIRATSCRKLSFFEDKLIVE